MGQVFSVAHADRKLAGVGFHHLHQLGFELQVAFAKHHHAQIEFHKPRHDVDEQVDALLTAQAADEPQQRTIGQTGIEIHLGQHVAFIKHALFGNDLQTLGEEIGFHPSMGFHHCDYQIGAVQFAAAALHQHLIGLADTRRCAQKDFQAAAPLLPRRLEQGFG